MNWLEEVTQGLSVRSCSTVIPKKRWKSNVEIVSNNVAPSLKRHQHECTEGERYGCQACMQTSVKRHPTFLCLVSVEGKCKIQSVWLFMSLWLGQQQVKEWEKSVTNLLYLRHRVFQYCLPADMRPFFLSLRYVGYWVSFKIILSKEKKCK